MTKKNFKVSEKAIYDAFLQIDENKKKNTSETLYRNAIFDLLQRNMRNRPLDGSEFSPDGSQTMKVCTGF